MKKILLMPIAFVCMLSALPAQSEEVFQTDASFQLAKAYKLGHGGLASKGISKPDMSFTQKGHTMSTKHCSSAVQGCIECNKDGATFSCTKCAEGKMLISKVEQVGGPQGKAVVTRCDCPENGTCNNMTNTLTCKSGYYKTNYYGADACMPCSGEGVAACDASGTPTACTAGNMLISKTVAVDGPQGKATVTTCGCPENGTCNNKTNTLTCNSGYNKTNYYGSEVCVCASENATACDASGTPTACTAGNMLRRTSTGGVECSCPQDGTCDNKTNTLTCRDGYREVGGSGAVYRICVPCGPYVAKCETTRDEETGHEAYKVLACIEGAGLDQSSQQCLSCPDKCEACHYEGAAKPVCESCADGYTLENGSCVAQCIYACATKNNNGLCTSCEPGYELTANGCCTMCSAGYYSTANYNDRSCKKCASGTYSYPGDESCAAPASKVKGCTKMEYRSSFALKLWCTECENGYTAKNGVCVPNDSANYIGEPRGHTLANGYYCSTMASKDNYVGFYKGRRWPARPAGRTIAMVYEGKAYYCNF